MVHCVIRPREVYNGRLPWPETCLLRDEVLIRIGGNTIEYESFDVFVSVALQRGGAVVFVDLLCPYRD